MPTKLVVPMKKNGIPICNIDVVHFKRCMNPDCYRPFKVNRFIGQTSGLTDMGKLICPHCGSHIPAEANSIYLAHAMTTSEESDFTSWIPGEAGKSW